MDEVAARSLDAKLSAMSTDALNARYSQNLREIGEAGFRDFYTVNARRRYVRARELENEAIERVRKSRREADEVARPR